MRKMLAPRGDMTNSLCRILDGAGDASTLSVQRVCSLIKEDLRTAQLSSTVFASQLGGQLLLDIYLPRLTPPQTRGRQGLLV